MNMYDSRFADKSRRAPTEPYDFIDEARLSLPDRKAWKSKPSRSDDLIKATVRFVLWWGSVLVLSILCTELVIRFSGIEVTNRAAIWYMPDELTLRNLALFFLLPLTLYWVFFLCAGWNDPFRARLYGIVAGVLSLFALETSTFILHAASMAQTGTPAAFPSADSRQTAYFLIIALVLTGLLGLGYLLGPVRLVNNKWKNADADMTTR